MKDIKYKKFICWGITALAVIIVALVFIFSILKYSRIEQAIKLLFGILAPVIYGAVMAYLLSPVYNRICAWVMKATKKKSGNQKLCKQIGAVSGTIVSVMVLCAAVFGLIVLMLPELLKSMNSVVGIIGGLPAIILKVQEWLSNLLSGNEYLEQQVMLVFSNLVSNIQEWVQQDLIPSTYNVIMGISSGALNVAVQVKNIIIGLIVMVYLLNMKPRLITQGKMILYGIFPLRWANKILQEIRYVHVVFGGFILGKIVDSIIIGLMCFVLLSFMNMPYPLLVSVVIGCTNIIPFFGPFIGAVPTSILILLVSPVKCLYFIVFILLLQLFDGYILGPRILGGSTGLSSFWVLFSILLFGGLFGFVGMIIAVPTFAVIYKLTTEFVTWRLCRKNLSCNIDDYEGLDHIDAGEKTYLKK